MVLYAATIFSGAFLLFLVQPLIAKFILPWFGGSPGVWTVCMLFFQVLLLAGYAYAHLVTRWLPARLQGILHLVLLAAAVLALPITPNDAWKPGGGDDPTARILFLLAASIGIAYFVLSTTGPLLQRWFSVLHGEAPPYRLFALSNAASLLALLAYPFLIEPAFERGTQTAAWSWGLGVFAVLCAGCAIRVMRSGAPPTATRDTDASIETPARGVVMLWLALPTVASLMLLATTNRLCEEMASLPFLWVLPLAIYLLSFVLCFDHPRWYRRVAFGAALLICIAQYDGFFGENSSMRLAIVVHGAIFFVVCMICHGELYRLRPHPRYLTRFYLMTAAGGALGGVIVALVAPLLFIHHEEFEIGLVACALLGMIVHFRDPTSPLHAGRPRFAWACLLAAYCGLAWTLASNQLDRYEEYDFVTRDFYGTLGVRFRDAELPMVPVLESGNTIHGMQVQHEIFQRMPTTYYGKQSGVGRALLARPKNGSWHVGAVGLGVGTLASYGRPGDRMRFYEIDPRVIRLARERFTFLEDSDAEIEVVVGDARLSLEGEPDQKFDVLVLDAFSSDAIPVHLLTHEVFETYLRHLREAGVIAVHISNRHLDLRPVLDAHARSFGLATRNIIDDGSEYWWVEGSSWVLMSRDGAFFDASPFEDSKTLEQVVIKPIEWTDAYTALLPILR